MISLKKSLTAALGVGVLALTLSIPSLSSPNAASAQVTTPAQTPARLRGERGSALNLLRVRRRVERLIDQMQHDQRDYGGYRVKAHRRSPERA